jgi:hypothetical protein
MKEQIVKLLGLKRDKIFQDAKIPKTKFFELEDFNAENKRIFTNEIEEITLLAILNEETINIAPFKNDEVNYSEIYIVYVALKKSNNSPKIIETIQKNIPNPTIIILNYKDQLCLATANKRLNKAEKGKQVIEDEQRTGWLTLNSSMPQEKSYLEGLNIGRFSFLNLNTFYQEFSLYIYQAVLLPFVSEFKFLKHLPVQAIKPSIDNFLAKQAEITTLKDEESKTLNFGDKIAIHQKVIQAEKELNKAKEDTQSIIIKHLK